ncbi:MAG: FAD-dependent oxidoreductase [Myxococcota bacterium]
MHPGAPSLWLDEAPGTRLEPLEPRSHRVDALVIGLGITGATAALELAEAGVSVLALDAHGLGWGASARSGGFLLVEHAIEYPDRRRRFGEDRMRVVVEMARANHALVESRFAQGGEHRRCGSLILPMADDPTEQETLTEAARLLQADGVPCETGVRLEGFDAFAPGVAIPEDGEVHPGKLLATIGREAANAGAQLRQGHVTALDPQTRRAHVGDTTIDYGVAVVAVNAWTRALVPDIAIEPQRAQMLATAPTGSGRTIGPVCYACWGYDYFRQREDGRVMLGGRRHLHRDAEVTDDSVPTPAVQASLDRYLSDHLAPMGPLQVQARWSGIMGFSPDELPFWAPLSDASGADNTHVLGGMTGHGMGLGGVCGQTIAARCHATPSEALQRRADLLHVNRLRTA